MKGLDSAGKEAEQKLRENWITRYKDARAKTLLIGQAVGMPDAEATIEDLFPEDYYLDKTRESHENKLKSKGLSTDRIVLKGSGGPILPRLSQCFKEMGVHFNKGSVAKRIRRDLIRYGCGSFASTAPRCLRAA